MTLPLWLVCVCVCVCRGVYFVVLSEDPAGIEGDVQCRGGEKRGWWESRERRSRRRVLTFTVSHLKRKCVCQWNLMVSSAVCSVPFWRCVRSRVCVCLKAGYMTVERWRLTLPLKNSFFIFVVVWLFTVISVSSGLTDVYNSTFLPVSFKQY